MFFLISMAEHGQEQIKVKLSTFLLFTGAFYSFDCCKSVLISVPKDYYGNALYRADVM